MSTQAGWWHVIEFPWCRDDEYMYMYNDPWLEARVTDMAIAVTPMLTPTMTLWGRYWSHRPLVDGVNP